jgi:hypothetical protein
MVEQTFLGGVPVFISSCDVHFLGTASLFRTFVLMLLRMVTGAHGSVEFALYCSGTKMLFELVGI